MDWNHRGTMVTKVLLTAGMLAGSGVWVKAIDWPQYRGPNHDGISPEKILKSWPAPGPKVLWKTPMTDGFSCFAVAGGKAVTVVKREIEGSAKEVCVALEAASGKELWAAVVDVAKYDGGGDSGTPDNRGGDGPRSTPSIDGERVYVLTASLKLCCLNLADGKEVWGKDVRKEYSGKVIQWQNAASPLIDGELVFVSSTGPGQSLLAFQKADGALAWKGFDDKMTHATPVAATILGARQIVFFTQSGLVSVAPATGKELWRFKFRYNVSTAASPVVAGDLVYCSAGYDVGAGLVRISKSGDGFAATEVWVKPKQLINHWSTPVFQGGYLYGMFGFKEFGKGALKCVELASGKEMWAKEGFGPGGVVWADGQIVALSDSGQVVLVEATPKAYEEVSRFAAIQGKCWNAPVLSEGKLYVRGTREGACLDVSPQ